VLDLIQGERPGRPRSSASSRWPCGRTMRRRSRIRETGHGPLMTDDGKTDWHSR